MENNDVIDSVASIDKVTTSTASDIIRARLQVRELENKKKREFKEQRNYYERLLREKEESKKLQVLQQAKEEEKMRIILVEQEEKKRRDEELTKTRNYFVLNRFNNKNTAPGAPIYIGDLKKKSAAWIPQGTGQFILNGEVGKGINILQ